MVFGMVHPYIFIHFMEMFFYTCIKQSTLLYCILENLKYQQVKDVFPLVDLLKFLTVISTSQGVTHKHFDIYMAFLRYTRACVVDSLGLGITCVLYHSLYYVYKASQSCLLCFYAIPTYILHSNFLVSPHFYITILKSADNNGASIQQCYEQQKKLDTGSLEYLCTCT